MNIPSSNSSLTASLRTRSDVQPTPAQGPPDRSEHSKDLPQLRHTSHDRPHARRHHRDGEEDRRATAARSDTAAASLKVRIEQTFSSLLGDSELSLKLNARARSTDSGFEGVFKAKFELSGPDGSVEAKLKFKLTAENSDGAVDFSQALQGFADALYATLRTLYNAAPAAPAASPGAQASPTTPGAAATPAAAPSSTPAPTLAAPPAAAAPSPVPAPTAAASTPTVAPVATPDVASSPLSAPTTSASRAFSVQFRASYDSFSNNLSPWVQRLAQPGAGDDRPDVADMLRDLAQRFSQVLSFAPRASGSTPSLGEFLTALSQSLADTEGPAPGAAPTSPSTTTANTPASAPDAVTSPGAPSAPTAPSADAIATDSNPAAASAAPSSASTPGSGTGWRYTAMAEYSQVLSYREGDTSITMHANLRTRMVYETA